MNVLGLPFFLPFVLLQFLDLVFLRTVGWASLAVIPAHTLVLAWESVAVSLYARTLLAAGKWFVPVSALVLTAVWIAVCAPVWR
jgi:hypothetical protein